MSGTEIEPRLYGLESEHGNYGTYPLAMDKAGEEIIVALRKTTPLQYANDYYSNGSRIYMDAGRHLEYAKPECQTLRDLVASDWAGNLVLADTVDGMTDEGRPEYSLNTRIIDFNSRSLGDNDITWGSHENYRTPPHINPQDRRVAVPLLTHLATRNLLVGAGMVTPRNDFGFAISQKARDISGLVNSTSTTNKPLILNRHENLADGQQHYRLQVVGGDPTMIPWATAVRFGSTALLLRMIEAGENLTAFTLQNTLHTNKTVSTDISMKRKVKLLNGRAVRPVDIQLALAAKSLDFIKSHDVPEEEVIVAHEWHQGIQDLKTDRYKLIGKSDWVTKLALIERRLERMEQARKAGLEYGEAYDVGRGVDISWGELSQEGTAVRAFMGGRLEDPLAAADLAELYKVAPPPGRARERSALIRAFAAHVGMMPSVEWHHVTSDGSDTLYPLKVMMPNPFGNNVGIKEHLRAIRTGALRRR